MGDKVRWRNQTRAEIAATVDEAHALGRVAPGFAPDLVIVRGRPWLDLASLTADNIVAVICRGRLTAGAVSR
jgi:imidazolonepropionase-like amidohydrolase